jgi:hypothetical protein
MGQNDFVGSAPYLSYRVAARGPGVGSAARPNVPLTFTSEHYTPHLVCDNAKDVCVAKPTMTAAFAWEDPHSAAVFNFSWAHEGIGPEVAPLVVAEEMTL